MDTKAIARVDAAKLTHLARVAAETAAEMFRVAAEIGQRGLVDLADDLRLQAQELGRAIAVAESA